MSDMVITIRREQRLSSEAGIISSWVEETHTWPASTCSVFKKMYPDSVVSITKLSSSYEKTPKSAYKSYRRWNKTRGDRPSDVAATKKKETSGNAFDTASLINEAIRNLP